MCVCVCVCMSVHVYVFVCVCARGEGGERGKCVHAFEHVFVCACACVDLNKCVRMLTEHTTSELTSKLSQSCSVPFAVMRLTPWC